ncbi:MAG: hypothetical protein ABL961_18455 [Vicinamibacterales bacterium]
MPLGAPKDISDCALYFLDPKSPKQRQYEALRAYFVEEQPSAEVARAFGYTPGSFQVMCHHFRRDPSPNFFVSTRPGPRDQPKKSAAREIAVSMRKTNHSVYEISEALKSQKIPLSPTAVRELLRADGFAALPRRLDEERPGRPRPTVQPTADARAFSLTPRQFDTQCGGLFLFIPELARLQLDEIARTARLPGSKMVPAGHALRSCLALKLWSLERKSHVMSLVADEGLAFFAGLNAIPKKSFLSEYSSRIGRSHTTRILEGFQRCVTPDGLYDGESFNLDFHSVPFHGEDEMVEKHYVSMRSRSQKSVLAFLAQDAAGRAFCYSNADIRKGEESEEIFRFISFWTKAHGSPPKHLVFDSRLTTYPKLARLDRDHKITFITLRRKSPALMREIALLPASAWRTVELDVPTRKYRFPRVFEQTTKVAGREYRQLFILDLGHEKPTILLTNDRDAATPALITRYAQRMLIENALSDAVRFFHIDALSSAVGLKVDFDMSLLVIASGLYRLLARKMRGYSDVQARKVFRNLLNMPATVDVRADEVVVQLHKRTHLPLLVDAGVLDAPVAVPWWNGMPLRITS